MSASYPIVVPNQPGDDTGHMHVEDRNGVAFVTRYKRSVRAKANRHVGSVSLTKHQQIALRDWLCVRWGIPS